MYCEWDDERKEKKLVTCAYLAEIKSWRTSNKEEGKKIIGRRGCVGRV
jgi:hypothetical protein